MMKIEYNYKKFKREQEKAWMFLSTAIFVGYLGFVFLASGLPNGMMQIIVVVFSFFEFLLTAIAIALCIELALLRKLKEIELKNKIE